MAGVRRTALLQLASATASSWGLLVLSVNKFLKDLWDLRKFFAQSFRTTLSINGGLPLMHCNEKCSVKNNIMLKLEKSCKELYTLGDCSFAAERDKRRKIHLCRPPYVTVI